MKPIFKFLENLNLVLAKLNPELGTAQPQLAIYTNNSLSANIMINWGLDLIQNSNVMRVSSLMLS